MLHIKDSKSGLCDELGKWIMENEDNVDIQRLYDLERIYNDIDETALELVDESDADDLEERVEELEKEISDTMDIAKDAEEDLNKFLNNAEEVKHLIRKLKVMFEKDDVKVADIVDKIDDIIDEIDDKF